MKTAYLGAAVILVSVASGVACSANSGSDDNGLASGSKSNGSGATSSNGSGGTIGLGGTGSVTLPGDEGGAPAQGCYQYDVVWEPKTPTVYIVLDRSSSMKDYGLWGPIRDAILPVVEKLQGDVRFGFTAYTGMASTGCPAGALELDSVPIALDNYEAINALYAPLEPPTVSDTPTGPALDFARDQLAADTTPGDKFLLLVTDGQPDYCDNPTAKCAVDGVVRRIQELQSGGIRTLVFGFEGISSDNQAEIASLTWALQSFANAGAGEPVGVQAGMTREQYGVELTPGAVVFWDECSGYAPWKTEHEAAALPEFYPLGTYTAPAGAAPVFKPNPTDQQALITEFESVLSGVKSCSFDLATEIEEGTLKIDVNQLGAVDVQVQGMPIALDETGGQGWRMASETQLVLEGAACDLWRQKESTEIAFDFPCEVIVVVPK
ncbi:MAG TPA: vWA domain-containing protein [Polyangiaceae bacterium]|nr:vWA domain-containing protein [Polyangiaceae bacterium]